MQFHENGTTDYCPSEDSQSTSDAEEFSEPPDESISDAKNFDYRVDDDSDVEENSTIGTRDICRVNFKISLSHIVLSEKSVNKMNSFLDLVKGYYFLLFSTDITTHIRGIFNKEWCCKWLTSD